MTSWSTMRSRITASVRTTNRMNALLSESMIGKRKTLLNLLPAEGENCDKPANDLKFFRNNFSMERVHKIIETTIEDRLTWDRLSRSYDPWRSFQLAESLAGEIRDIVKKLKYKRHRIVCILSLIEKQNQGTHMSMRHLMDEKLDNFTEYVHERPTFFIVVVLFLVHKD